MASRRSPRTTCRLTGPYDFERRRLAGIPGAADEVERDRRGDRGLVRDGRIFGITPCSTTARASCSRRSKRPACSSPSATKTRPSSTWWTTSTSPDKDIYTHGQEEMRYLQDTWFQDDAYLKASGQPVLFIFGPQYFTNAADWETLFSRLDPRPAFITLDKMLYPAAIASYPWPPMGHQSTAVLVSAGARKLSERVLRQNLTPMSTWSPEPSLAFTISTKKPG